MDTNKNLIRPFVFCPKRTIRWRSVVGDMLVQNGIPDWPQFHNRTVIPFYLGRVALWFLCEVWNLQPGDEVLMPAYNCGTEVDPFYRRGLRVIFYRVDQSGSIDLDNVRNRCGANTRVLYITHCLNQSQAVSEVYEWCKAKNVRVVEDCALALFSKISEGHLGTLADAAIFSFKKFLPVPDGGALVLRDPVSHSIASLRRPPFRRRLRNLLPFAKSSAFSMLDACRLYDPWVAATHRIRYKSKAIGRQYELQDRSMPRSYFFNDRYRDCTSSRIAAGVLRRTDPDVVVYRRRKNYEALVEFLDSVEGISIPRKVLDNGICPVGLFVTLPRRDRMVEILNTQGIDAVSWWAGYHRSFDWSEFPEACYLKDNTLYLPIDQSLDNKHIEYIAKCIKRAATILRLHDAGNALAATAASARPD